MMFACLQIKYERGFKMESAERKELLEYMKKAIDIETEVARQEMMITECNKTWDLHKPTPEILEIPNDTNNYYGNVQKDTSNSTKLGLGLACISFFALPLNVFIALGGCILGLIIWIITMILESKENNKRAKNNQWMADNYGKRPLGYRRRNG